MALLFLVAFTCAARAQLSDIQYTTTPDAGGGLIITGFSATGSGPLTIPGTINGLPVTSVGQYAFNDNTSLTSLILPDSVTSIGDFAFQDCSGLTSVTFGTGLTSIGNYAFHQCGGLATLTIPDGVTSIGFGAFNQCVGLTSVGFGHGVTNIGYRAFQYCSSLVSAYFNGNAPAMGNSVFDSTASGFTVFYYNSASGFNSPNWIDSSNDTYPAVQIIPYTTTPDGNGGLIISEYTGPNGVAVIPSVINGMVVTSIGPNAFEYSTGITAVIIPNSVTSIAGNAFISCTSLSQFRVSTENSTYSSVNGVIFDKSQHTLVQCPEGITGNYSIPNSVTSVGTDAFLECANLTSVTIPNSVTSIGNNAFADCSVLTSVTIPNSVTSIGISAFAGSGITSVTIGTGVTSIGDGAFDGSNLTTVAIPDNITSIGVASFQNCYNLTSVTIGNGVTTIGVNAFEFCNSLSQVTFGNSVTSIGAGAFEYCDYLTAVTIPASVTSIGSQAFVGGPWIGEYGYQPSGVRNAIFLGNAPIMAASVFGYMTGLLAPLRTDDFTAYYYNGATGFTSPTWDGYSAIDLGDPSDAFGGVVAGTNLKYSSWFGYYSNGAYPLVYQYNLGYEYVFPDAGGGVYLFDYKSGHFFYTQGSYYPFVYDFTLNAWLYYYQGNASPRYFYNYSTDQVISE